MFEARVQPGVTVVVSYVNRRARLDRLTTAGAAREARIDDRAGCFHRSLVGGCSVFAIP
jgi:hypothetical protein